MILVVLFELIVSVLLLYLGVTQLVVPLWRGTPLFPVFRKETHLRQQLSQTAEKVVEADLEREIAEKSHRASSIRKTVRRKTSESPNESDQTVN